MALIIVRLGEFVQGNYLIANVSKSYINHIYRDFDNRKTRFWMYHIVKRSAELNGRVGGKLSGGDSWFVQTALNKNPVGHLAKKNDIIYAHEIGRGVWAKGKITAIRNVVTINDLKVLIKYSQQTTNYNNAPFWDHIIQEKGSRLNGTNLLHIFEVRADLKKFYKEKALPVQYRSRQSWITLQVKPSFK